ncbi:MAG: hypothetical protein ACYCS1_07495 [Gammaproteobacteria bacterium]
MSILRPVWIGFGGGIGIVLLVWIGFKLRQAWVGYRERGLYRAFLKLSPWVAENRILPDGLGGRIHADYLILTSSALHWISVFQVQGSVFGSHNMSEWTVLDSEKRWTFPNPLATLPQKSGALHALIGDAIPVVMDLLFLGDPVFPKGRVDGIWLLDEYFEHLKSEVSSAQTHPEAWQNLWGNLLTASTEA